MTAFWTDRHRSLCKGVDWWRSRRSWRFNKDLLAFLALCMAIYGALWEPRRSRPRWMGILSSEHMTCQDNAWKREKSSTAGIHVWRLSLPINPLPNKLWFLRVRSTSLWKTLWEMEKLLVTSNFSFFHSVCYPICKLFAIFIKSEIVVCELFQFGRDLILSFGKG